MPRLLAVLAVAATVGVSACGDDDDTATTQAPAAATTASCEQAPKVLVDALTASLTTEGESGLGSVNMIAVPDPPPAPVPGYEEGVYAVAAVLTGEGIEGQTVVWVVPKPMLSSGNGLAIGADSTTRDLSELGANAAPSSPAVAYAGGIADSAAGDRVRACAEGA